MKEIIVFCLLVLPIFAKEGSGKMTIATVDPNYLRTTTDTVMIVNFADCGYKVSTKFLRTALIRDSLPILRFKVNRGIKLAPDTSHFTKSDLSEWEGAFKTADSSLLEQSTDVVSAPASEEVPASEPTIPAVAPAATDETQTTPLYGVTRSGIYFVAIALITAVDGAAPSVKYETKWDRHPMTKFGDYYIFRTGRRFILPSATYCFDIGGNEYLPHVLKKGRGDGILNQIDLSEAVDNDNHGYNFRTKPINTDFFK